MAVIAVNGDNYKTLVEGATTPVLIDFFATWCGPCKMLSPLVSEAADELENECRVVKIDVDEAPELAMKFGIEVIPTLVLIKDGAAVRKSVGYIDKSKILAFVRG